MSRYLPAHMSNIGALWLRGIGIRACLVHLSFGLAMYFEGYPILLPFWVVAIEGLVFVLYVRACRQKGPLSAWAISWVAISDVHFFLAAVFFALISGLIPVWGYWAGLGLWLAAVVAEVRISYALPLPRQVRPADVASAVDKAGRKRSLPRPTVNTPMTIGLGVFAMGLLGAMVGYARSSYPEAALGISVMSLGLSVAFTFQTRHLLLAYRFRKLPWR